ncbi:MAG: hypothetical protein CMJ88_08215, partial [Planctomycetes bacterium]|nr:hypothetical protein [Planctomycetota bacterium]
MFGDTIVALASASGAGERAVLRISGPRAFEAAERVFSPSLTRCTTRRASWRAVHCVRRVCIAFYLSGRPLLRFVECRTELCQVQRRGLVRG